MQVPFVDLRAQHDELRTEIDRAIKEIVDSSSFIGGTRVEQFEHNFAAYCNSLHAASCASGTDALKLALMGTGVQRGDAIITTPHTFIASVEAITLAGAYPLFVDVDEVTGNLSPSKLAECLELRCRRDGQGRLVERSTGRPVTGVLPVHLYGLPADMKPILDLARAYNLKVIEDACQAHGASYHSDGEARRVGTLGDVAAFSFYPGKNLGAMGEGGAVTTNSTEMDRAMRVWRDHGQSERYIHVSSDGWNGRLDTMQCAILDIKLKKLDEWNARRRQAASWYRDRLSHNEGITLPVEPEGCTHVYHLFVVRLPNRQQARQLLTEQGIGVGLHYPIPLHLQEAYSNLGYSLGEFPVAEALSSSILSLPMFPHITEQQVEYVCDSLNQCVSPMHSLMVRA